MKKMILSLIALLAIATQASAMSYEQARNEALFLTDKMAYELNLTDAQYEAAYEINLDYLMGVTSQHDVFGSYWERRNADIRYILYSWQWDAFCAASYFFRPLYWNAGYWHFGVYARYPHRDYLYYGRPHFYVTYRGGHSWRMNGGRSYYERHHDHYRPHVDRHHGMRDGWDRGDYRHNNYGRNDNHHNNHHGRNNGNYDNGQRHDNSHGGRTHDNVTNRRNDGNHENSGRGNGNRDNGGRSNHQITAPVSGASNMGSRSASTVSSTRTTANRHIGNTANRNVGDRVNRSTSAPNRSAGINRSTHVNRSASVGHSTGTHRNASANRGAGNRSEGGRR
jgi:hypothetical protein